MASLRIAPGSGVRCSVNPDCATRYLCALEQRKTGGDAALIAVEALRMMIGRNTCPPVSVIAEVACDPLCPGNDSSEYEGYPRAFTVSVGITPAPRARNSENTLHL